MEEYLTVDELSSRIKFSRQSLYNLIYKGTFVLGKHYLKPTNKKILFKWSEILLWLGDDLPGCNQMQFNDEIACSKNEQDFQHNDACSKSRIKI